MNRTRHENADFIPVFLAKAGALGERAARAMCPNGSTFTLATKNERNVITLRDANLSVRMDGDPSTRLNGVRWSGKTDCTNESDGANPEVANDK